MTDNAFMKQLASLLQPIPEPERSEILYDFEEHFALATQSGKSQADISQDLGSPKLIARELLADYQITRAEKERSIGNISRAVFAVVGLSFFNLIFVLGPAIALVAIYLVLAVTAVAFILTPLGVLVVGIVTQSYPLFKIFASMALLGLGLLLGVGLIRVGKFLYRVFLRYLKTCLNLMKGDRHE